LADQQNKLLETFAEVLARVHPEETLEIVKKQQGNQPLGAEEI
jgi:hypothetical protein